MARSRPGATLLARLPPPLHMVDKTELEREYEYTVETDDGTSHVHLYYAKSIDTDNPSCLKFNPVYESGDGVERKVESETMLVPYIRVIRVIKRNEPE